ncbi:hypothetical protein [Mesorhizobium erdmanii]|nr:hypothetical protein [Mesorhizobium erdmanii]
MITHGNRPQVRLVAVTDKDLASSLLARQLNAGMLLMLTNIDAV